MTPIRDMMKTRSSLLAALGLILAWSMTAATSTWAQDDHDGHDHASHAEEAGHDEHADEEHGEGEEDAHGEEVVRLTEAELQEFGVTLQTAQAGVINKNIAQVSFWHRNPGPKGSDFGPELL